MKVLHISHIGLPDWRIEKSAITGINCGYRTFFAGNLLPDHNTNDSEIFEKLYKIECPDSNYPTKLFLQYILFGKTSIWNSVKKDKKY